MAPANLSTSPAGRLARMGRTSVVVAVMLTALALGACSNNNEAEADRVLTPTAVPAPAGVGPDGSELTLEVVDGGEVTGRIITDHRGFVVYGVTGETPPDQLVCDADCTDVWIPVVPRDGTVASALDPTLFATFTRPDGTEQATYSDIALYLWSGDREIGITGGAGVAGTWFALTETAGFISP